MIGEPTDDSVKSRRETKYQLESPKPEGPSAEDREPTSSKVRLRRLKRTAIYCDCH